MTIVESFQEKRRLLKWDHKLVSPCWFFRGRSPGWTCQADACSPSASAPASSGTQTETTSLSKYLKKK